MLETTEPHTNVLAQPEEAPERLQNKLSDAKMPGKLDTQFQQETRDSDAISSLDDNQKTNNPQAISLEDGIDGFRKALSRAARTQDSEGQAYANLLAQTDALTDLLKNADSLTPEQEDKLSNFIVEQHLPAREGDRGVSLQPKELATRHSLSEVLENNITKMQARGMEDSPDSLLGKMKAAKESLDTLLNKQEEIQQFNAKKPPNATEGQDVSNPQNSRVDGNDMTEPSSSADSADSDEPQTQAGQEGNKSQQRALGDDLGQIEEPALEADLKAQRAVELQFMEKARMAQINPDKAKELYNLHKGELTPGTGIDVVMDQKINTFKIEQKNQTAKLDMESHALTLSKKSGIDPSVLQQALGAVSGVKLTGSIIDHGVGASPDVSGSLSQARGDIALPERSTSFSLAT